MDQIICAQRYKDGFGYSIKRLNPGLYFAVVTRGQLVRFTGMFRQEPLARTWVQEKIEAARAA